MIEIREARLEDLDAIVSLLGQLEEATRLHAPLERATVQKSFVAMLRSPELYRNYVAREDSQVVGLISVVLYKTFLHTGGTALINELVVSESARRRGIGGKLVETAIAAAQESGMEEIEVGTEKDNSVARRFYSSIGFNNEYVLFGMEF